MASTIKDILEEYTFLYEPLIIISEWIPFGPNQFSHFCEALSAYRRDEIFITSEIDTNPEAPLFRVIPEFACVRISDYEEGKNVKFISRIFYSEEGGVVQKEEIGVRVDESGFIFYSCKLRKCGLARTKGGGLPLSYASLDRLARIVTDLMEDTSTLMHSMLNSYQKRILSVVYPRSHEELYERKKMLCMITTKVIYKNKDLREIVRSEGLEKVLGKYSDFRKEVQQVLGYVTGGIVLANGDIIIRGKDGLLVVTDEKNIGEYIDIVKIIISLLAIEAFYIHLFSRVWIIWDTLGHIRSEIFSPNSRNPIDIYRVKLSTILADTVILWDVDHLARFAMKHLNRQIEKLKEAIKSGEKGNQDYSITRAILKIVNVDEVLEVITSKIEATKSVLEAFRMDINGLTSLINTFMEREMREIRKAMWKSIDKQTRMMQIEKAEKERLELIEFLSAGLLVAEILSLLFAWIETSFGMTFGGWEYLFSIIAIFILALLLRAIIRKISIEETIEESQLE